jgi:hypothetical protein
VAKRVRNHGAPPTRTSTRVEWVIQPVVLSTVSFPVARLRIRLYLVNPPSHPESSFDIGWVDTGAPLSVVPFHVHWQRLLWQPIPGITTTWSGQPCDLGRIDCWLPTQQPPYLRGLFSLLAKFARSDPPGDPVPVLLGLEFLLS